MQTRIINSDTCSNSDFEKIYSYLKNHSEDLENYTVTSWEENPSSLLYIFKKTDRFHLDNGGLVLLENDSNELCGISGFNRSDFDSNVYILGVRTLIAKHSRGKLYMSKYIIPAQIDAVKNKAKMILFLFDCNDNINLYTVFVKDKLNQFLNWQLNKFQHLYSTLCAVEFPVIINYAKQNVLYITLDKNFSFDWRTLR